MQVLASPSKSGKWLPSVSPPQCSLSQFADSSSGSLGPKTAITLLIITVLFS